MKVRLFHAFVVLVSICLFIGGAEAAEKKAAEKTHGEKKDAKGKTAGARPVEEKKTSPNDLLKEADFAEMLVKSFGWQGGLPGKPTDNDYLAILDGRRVYQFEAEEHFSRRTDNVSLQSHEKFGPFSGKGWLSGITETTSATLTVHLPLEGDYTLKVVSRGDNHVWYIGGQTLKVNSGSRFSQQVAGTVHLKEGEQVITVDIAPEGAVDYIILEASPLRAIEPLEGWRPEQQLTLAKVAEIGASLLGWEKALPDDPQWKGFSVTAAESALLPATVKRTNIQHLGTFTGKEWVRADAVKSEIRIPLIIDTSAAYDVKVRFLGDKLVGNLDGRRIEKPGKPYLEWVDLGITRLRRGAHTLILELPPRGGVDVVRLGKRKSTPDDYLKLVGLEGDPAAVVTRAQADKFLTSFKERFKERN